MIKSLERIELRYFEPKSRSEVENTWTEAVIYVSLRTQFGLYVSIFLRL